MNLSAYISNWRAQKGIGLKELVAKSGIDQALLTKYENGKRIPSEKDLIRLSNALNADYEEIRKLYVADKILKLLESEDSPQEILAVAETRVEYLTSSSAPKLTTLSNEIKSKLEEIDELKKKWQASKLLNALQVKKMEEYFNILYTYESNRIEGNTLTYQETHLVVNEGLTVGGKSMVDHLEAINHSEAVDWLKQMVQGDEDINKRNVLQLHQLVLKSVDSANAGVYRGVPVRITESKHEPPQPYLLDKLMEDYFLHYMKQSTVLHPVILAAEMHERLVSIHPFVDGNGRTSRLVMNFILLRNGYTIANLKGDYESRMKYYKALEEVQVDNNPEPFYHLILDEVRNGLIEHLKMV